MNFIYLKSLFITWMAYLDPTYWPAPSWLVSSVSRALHRYRGGHGFKSRTGLNFFQVIFSTTSSVVFLAARISSIRFFTAVQIYEFHISKIVIHRKNMEIIISEFNRKSNVLTHSKTLHRLLKSLTNCILGIDLISSRCIYGPIQHHDLQILQN